MLVVRRGPNAGSRYVLDAEVTALGRHPDSDVFLDDITVSRRHANVRRVDGGYEVADVGSLNGTYVDHQRVDRAPLHHLVRPPDRAFRAAVPRRGPAHVSARAGSGWGRPPVDRGGAGGAQRRVPRHHDLEDPLPREPGPHRPRAHAVGLPQVLRRRPHPAAVDPLPAEGELPPAEGDQGAPRRARARRPDPARRRGTRGGRGGRDEEPRPVVTDPLVSPAEAPVARRGAAPRRRPSRCPAGPAVAGAARRG